MALSFSSVTPSSSNLMKTQFGLVRGTIPCCWRTSLNCSSFTTRSHEDLILSSTTGEEDAGGHSAHLQSLLPSTEAERLCCHLNSTERGIKQKVLHRGNRHRGFAQQKEGPTAVGWDITKYHQNMSGVQH